MHSRRQVHCQRLVLLLMKLRSFGKELKQTKYCHSHGKYIPNIRFCGYSLLLALGFL